MGNQIGTDLGRIGKNDMIPTCDKFQKVEEDDDDDTGYSGKASASNSLGYSYLLILYVSTVFL